LFLASLVLNDALPLVAGLCGFVVARLLLDTLFPGHFFILANSSATTRAQPKSSTRATKNQACAQERRSGLSCFLSAKDTSMITLHYQPGRRILRPREIMYRRPRAFDDPGAEQLDDWMAACPEADTPYPAASP
jgi:hypothetical protein